MKNLDIRHSLTRPSFWTFISRTCYECTQYSLWDHSLMSEFTAHEMFGRSVMDSLGNSYSGIVRKEKKMRRNMTSWIRSSPASWPHDLSQECVRGSVWKNKGWTPVEEVKNWRKWDTGRFKMICWREETPFSCCAWEMSQSLEMDSRESVLSERFGFFKNLLENFTRRSQK